MGIWESLNPNSGRSAGSIDDITSAVARVQKQKKLAENTQRLRDAMTTRTRSMSPMQQAYGGFGVPTTENADLIQAPKSLANMNMDDLTNVSSILQETPELSQTVQLLQQAVAARQPKRFNLSRGERQYSEDPLTHQITPGVENPFEFPPEKPYETPEQKLNNAVEEHRQKLELEKKMGAGSFKPQREPIPNPETVRKDHAQERANLQKEKQKLLDEAGDIDLRMTQANQGMVNGKLIDPKDASQKVLMQETITSLQRQLRSRTYRINEIDNLLGGTATNNVTNRSGKEKISLPEAREYYRNIDENAPELQMSNEEMKTELEKAGYEVSE